MYSGNPSALHPLDAVLQATLRLRNSSEIAFVIVGGGSEFVRVKAFPGELNLTKVVCLSYQPLEHLASSLSGDDLQGDPFVWVGPPESHIMDLLLYPGLARMGRFVRHGDVDQAVDLTTKLAAWVMSAKYLRPGRPADLDRFSQVSFMPAMIALIETMAPNRRAQA
jgi:hypothetical protein